MKTYVIITADTNNADYVSKCTEISSNDIPRLERIAAVIKSNGGSWNRHHYIKEYHVEVEYEGLLSKDDIDFIDGMRPYGKNGIHTIEKIEILEAASKKKLI